MSEKKSKRGAAAAAANEAKDEAGSSAKEGQLLGTLDNPKPGQIKITPSPGNGERVFYETLLEQRPDSEMAQDWCLQNGVLDEKAAARLMAVIAKRKANPPSQKKAPPPAAAAAAAAAASKSGSSSRGKKSSDPDEIGMDVDDAGGGSEGRGSIGL